MAPASSGPQPRIHAVCYESLIAEKVESMHVLCGDTAFSQDFTELVFDALRSVGELVDFARGEPVFTEGEVADAIYIVESGCFDVTCSGDTGPATALRRGALFSSSKLAETQRCASVTARVRSKVHKVPAREFFALCSRVPELSEIVIRELEAHDRIGHKPRPAVGPHARRIFTFVLAKQTARQDLLVAVVEEVRKALHANRTTTMSIDLSSQSVSTIGESGTETIELRTQLHSRHGDVVLISVNEQSPRFEEAIAAADRVLIVADEGSNPGTAPELLQKVDLIYTGPIDLNAWDRSANPVCLHRFEEEQPASSAARLARRLRGSSIGLVLSGGGARAFAHLGVVAEIVDRGIIIDRIGASSMGAFVAARLALGDSVDEATAFFHQMIFEDPIFARYGPQGITALADAYGDHLIEDLTIPFSCISTDLVTGSAFVHRHGSLRFALHAGMALPGLVPPVVDGSRVLIDGATVDAFPVERMRKEGGGPILASDVTGRLDRMQRWATRWSAPENGQVPEPLDVAVQAMDIATMDVVFRGRELADVLFRPVVHGGTLAFHKIDAFIDAGRRHAAQVLDALPAGALPS